VPSSISTLPSLTSHMHDPQEPLLAIVKRILHYLQGTPEFGLLLRWSSVSDLTIYTNAN
jgi:hypothetical protein